MTAAGQQLEKTLAEQGGSQALQTVIKTDGMATLEKQLNNVIAHSVVRGEPISEQMLNNIVGKIVTEGASAEQRAALTVALKTSLESSGREITEGVVKSSLSGMTRQAATYGTLGGTTNVALEGSIAAVNGQQLDGQDLLTSFGIGFGAGAGLSATFDSVMAASRARSIPEQNPSEIPDLQQGHVIDSVQNSDVINFAPETEQLSSLSSVNGNRWTRDLKAEDIFVSEQGNRLRITETYPDGSMDMIATEPGPIVGGIYNARKGTFKEIPRVAGASQDDISTLPPVAVEQRLKGVRQNLIGAVADEDCSGRHHGFARLPCANASPSAQDRGEANCSAVRDGGQRARRRAIGVLVGVELDHIRHGRLLAHM